MSPSIPALLAANLPPKRPPHARSLEMSLPLWPPAPLARLDVEYFQIV